MFVSNGVVFFSSGVMFSSNLAFCLFKRIASNEWGGRFLHQASLWFFVLFPKENKIQFEL